jgi:hypothetical protein
MRLTVGLVRDVRQTGRDGVGEREVEHPVRRGRERDGLGADAHWEDLSRVCPGDGAHGDGEPIHMSCMKSPMTTTTTTKKGNIRAYEEVRADDDRFCGRVVTGDEPDLSTVGGGTVRAPPVSKAALETPDEEEEEAHEEGADEKHWATAPAVDIDDGRDGERDVEDILDGGGDKVAAAAGETGTLEDVDDVVPVKMYHQPRFLWVPKTNETDIMMFMPVS